MSSEYVIKYELFLGKDIFPKKDLLEKIVEIKIFKYLPLGKELNAETDIAEKQYQKLDDTYKLDKIIEKENPTFKKYNKSNLIYYSNYSIFKYYRNIKKSDNLSFKSMCSFLISFINDLDKCNELKPQKEKKKCVWWGFRII